MSSSPSSLPVQRMVSSPSGGQLLEGHRPLPEQLQQGEEAGHRGHQVRRVAGQRPEGRACAARRSRSTTTAAWSRTLTAGACRWASEITSACFGASALAASAANRSGPIGDRSPRAAAGRTAARPRRRAGTAGPARPASPPARPPPACTPGTAAAGRTAGPGPPAGPDPRGPRSHPTGSSRAAFRSSRVAATTMNWLVWSRSQSRPGGLDVGDELVGDLGTAPPR